MPRANRKRTGPLIAASICGLLGGMVLLLALLDGGSMLYWNMTAGPIEPSGGKYDSLDEIALTATNVGRVLCEMFAAVFGITAAMFWWKERTRPAIVFTALFFVVMSGWAAIVETAKPREPNIVGTRNESRICMTMDRGWIVSPPVRIA